MRKFTPEQLRLKGKKGAAFALRDPKSAQGRKIGGTWDRNIPKVRALDVYWNYSWGSGLVPLQPRDL